MDIRVAVDSIGLAVDGVGVGVIVVAIGVAGVAFGRGLGGGAPFDSSYRQLRQSIGRGVLLGLELWSRATSSARSPWRQRSRASACSR